MSESEEWVWEAHYTDGSVLRQIDVHQFREIEQDRLKTFHVVCQENGIETRAPIIIQWRPGLKLIHFFYRVRQILGSNHGQICLTCFGYQEGSTKVILVIMPDGGIVLVDDINNITVEI